MNKGEKKHYEQGKTSDKDMQILQNRNTIWRENLSELQKETGRRVEMGGYSICGDVDF